MNNALSQIIDSNNWNFGTNFSTGEKGWTDMEFETMLSGQLLNNRLLINGNFGYRDNPMANTNFVGDFLAEWLVNRSGDIRLLLAGEMINSQPPDLRTYSTEVTTVKRCNLPLHRIIRPASSHRRSDRITKSPLNVKRG